MKPPLTNNVHNRRINSINVSCSTGKARSKEGVQVVIISALPFLATSSYSREVPVDPPSENLKGKMAERKRKRKRKHTKT